MPRAPLICLIGVGLLAACGGSVPETQNKQAVEAEPETVDIPQTVTEIAPGTTPMAERVAVIGLLNKRNGISRDLTMKPGQAFRVGDVIVRLRACETSAPWEIQKLTGAFVQLDVRNPKGQFSRVFSGWLYKETPSLNVVEHPIYDVWPKSCAMKHPAAAASIAREGTSASNLSSESNEASEATTGTDGALETAPDAPAAAPDADTGATPSAEANSAT